MSDNDKPIWEGPAHEHTRWFKARIMPDWRVVLVDDADLDNIEVREADEYDEVVVYRNATRALLAERDELQKQNAELVASRANLASKLLEQCTTIDELRATVAACTQANHNQFVLVQELRDRMTKLEAGNSDEQDKER